MACAAIFFAARGAREGRAAVPRGFVTTRGARFMVDGEPFRFVGANAAIVYGDDERELMPGTLRAMSEDGISVVRVWAFGEVDRRDTTTMSADWLRANPFRRAPDEWNEEAFVNLDRILVEAARNNLRVQICLTNWWPDTGGVTQYLKWAGITDAADKNFPHGVNVERAMLFYTNAETRRLYRQHVERIVARRNSITGKLYRDDPAIFGYELINEAQAPAGRWAERRAWTAEMSAFVKSLDPHHLVTPGTWGYRFSWERREWLTEQSLAGVDYCDVHVYPRDDADSFIETPAALELFLENRVAAARSVGKPLVVGEFGIPTEGFNKLSQPEWFRAYFESAARTGAGGAMFWIWTHVSHREYGITHNDPRDAPVRAEFARAAHLFDTLKDAAPSPRVLDAGQHLIPHQFAFEHAANDATLQPVIKELETKTLLYRFSPEQAARGRFEKLGGGTGYVWGLGAGFLEYVVPPREEWRKVGEIVVRAHIQPTPPFDAQGRINSTRVSLFINGTDCGSRLVPLVKPPAAIIQEWRVTSLKVRADAARGLSLTLRFAVEPAADQPFGLNISNFPYDSKGVTPLEVEVR